MKPGIFKKIIKPETDSPPAADPAAEENPFTSASQASHLPPAKRADQGTQSHDPFEDEVDFGFEAPETAPDSTPEPAATADPAFAIPEQKQMSQPSPTPPLSSGSDAESIRQLELRAIFGVDHEMGIDEILERSRKLKGVRRLNRVADGDTGTIDALKAMIGRLGFGSDPVQIYAGAVPLDFIRAGNVMLAVQTDGSFAPGVRETLIIVARELAKM